MPCPSMSLHSFALVAQLAHIVLAQIYQLSDVPVPMNRSLQTLDAFYIYSYGDAPQHLLGKPYAKFRNQRPYVKFHGLTATVGSLPLPAGVNVQDYAGIQLSIMRYADFWNLINPKNFCCTREDEQNGKCEKKDQLLLQRPSGATNADLDVYSFPIGFTNTPGEDVKISVNKTGVYILVYSNCGDMSDAIVTGSVVAKNSFGFLPGNEYHKMPFYGWLSLIYAALFAVWVLLVLRWWRELLNIQITISVVILFGLIESILWYSLLRDWNNTGIRRKVFFVVCILSSVLKSVFSYMMVLVAALGWGVTKPFLDRSTTLQIQALTVSYIVLDFIREVVLSFRHSPSLPMIFVLLCLLPVSLLNGGIFYWVFTALSDLIDILKDRRQFEKLSLFQYLSRILITAVAVATGALLYQIYELSQSMDSRWEFEWVFADGIPHIIFLVVLCAMMYLWAPHKYSQRYALSSTQPGCTDVEIAADVWTKRGFLDEQSDKTDSFLDDTDGDGIAKDSDLVDVLGGRHGQSQDSLR